MLFALYYLMLYRVIVTTGEHPDGNVDHCKMRIETGMIQCIIFLNKLSSDFYEPDDV